MYMHLKTIGPVPEFIVQNVVNIITENISYLVFGNLNDKHVFVCLCYVSDMFVFGLYVKFVSYTQISFYVCNFYAVC
jgi:hypothetical protein